MKEQKRGTTRMFRRTLRAASILALGAVAWALVAALPPTPATPASGWGGEVLAEIHEGVVLTSPIGVANACGLGASSCFKCHNGQRAAAASMDPATAPWHTQHKTVNNSCGGCHQGNPRLMKQELAHAKMLADPRTSFDAACKTCHSGGDSTELLKPYLSVVGGGKK